MKALIWTLVAFCLAVWSGVCWLGYQIISVGGRYAASHADTFGPDADAVEHISNWALLGTHLGEWLVIGVWIFGALATLGLGWLGQTFLPRMRAAATRELGEVNRPQV
jgi:hypothetical protein